MKRPFLASQAGSTVFENCRCSMPFKSISFLIARLMMELTRGLRKRTILQFRPTRSLQFKRFCREITLFRNDLNNALCHFILIIYSTMSHVSFKNAALQQPCKTVVARHIICILMNLKHAIKLFDYSWPFDNIWKVKISSTVIFLGNSIYDPAKWYQMAVYLESVWVCFTHLNFSLNTRSMFYELFHCARLNSRQRSILYSIKPKRWGRSTYWKHAFVV